MWQSCVTCVGAGALFLLASYSVESERSITSGASGADVLPGRPANPSEKLPELPSSRADRTVLALDLRERATVGEQHENQGGIAADAALVRRPEARRVLERPVADAGRNRDHREMGRRRRAAGNAARRAAAGSMGRERLDGQAGLHHQRHGLPGSGPHPERRHRVGDLHRADRLHERHLDYVARDQAERVVGHASHLHFLHRARSRRSSTTIRSGSIGSATKPASTRLATASTTSCLPGRCGRAT